MPLPSSFDAAVESPEAFDGASYELLDAGFVGHVRPHEENIAAVWFAEIECLSLPSQPRSKMNSMSARCVLNIALSQRF
jgi:hypothetical protein